MQGSVFQMLPSYTTTGLVLVTDRKKNLETVIYIWSLQHLLHARQMKLLSVPAV